MKQEFPLFAAQLAVRLTGRGLLAFAGRACVCPAGPVVTGIVHLKEFREAGS